LSSALNADYRNMNEGRNLRSVWTIATQPFPEAHFATFPEKLIEPCIKAGCPEGGIVLDPFFGSGTVGLVARRFSCNFIGIELSSDYIGIANKRLAQEVFDFGDPAGTILVLKGGGLWVQKNRKN